MPGRVESEKPTPQEDINFFAPLRPSSEIKIKSGRTFLIAPSALHVARGTSSVALSALQSFLMYSWASKRLSALLNPGWLSFYAFGVLEMSKLQGPSGHHQPDPSPTGRRTTATMDISKL